jgi:hypothetical protein
MATVHNTALIEIQIRRHTPTGRRSSLSRTSGLPAGGTLPWVASGPSTGLRTVCEKRRVASLTGTAPCRWSCPQPHPAQASGEAHFKQPAS